jgi:hypothetical protein
MSRRPLPGLLLCSLLLAPVVAHGQTQVTVEVDPSEPAGETEVNSAGTDVEVVADDAMTLRQGSVAVALVVGVNLSKQSAGVGDLADPMSVSPDVSYGLTDRLTLGLAHSQVGRTGLWSGLRGDSLCVAGDACDEVYDRGQLAARVALLERPSAGVAAIGGLEWALGADPIHAALRLGAEGLWHLGRIGVRATPTIAIGVGERDAGNGDVVTAPVEVMVVVIQQLQLGVQSGVVGPLDGFGDGYAIPLAGAIHFAVRPTIVVGVSYALDRVAGGGDLDATALRSATASVAWMN